MIKELRSALILLFFAVYAMPVYSHAENRTSNVSDLNDPSYKKALQALEKTVPLTYNKYVHNQIKFYVTNQKDRFARMVGLSQYYFPIYEKIFRDSGIPDEIKYLSVVESSLNPHAVSGYGAAGPWQFLNHYGKLYGLTINDTIDERKDPALACRAAAKYLQDSYDMYGDWLLAIASYNCGRNNIKWAMEKAEGRTDYWSLRAFLPVETQNYIPAYIATVYMMNNYRRHGILPVKADFPVETETLSITKSISLEAVSTQINISMRELYLLNPAYVQLNIIASPQNPKSLVIPVLPVSTYNSLCALLGLPGRNGTPVTPHKTARYSISYRVQEGDTFASIAEKFKGTTAEEIKAVNQLTSETLQAGVLLKILLYED